ncbi:hypothetical protein BV25DRAFT_1922485 [Artomyces pyxidatus]|uniref:Uncharacterized protein n=1 Tax=Artomyces pyxidatus TaxID=48021 RepID=A0ACB8SDY9_9AGAM|nr:hypothetical protein BV25DRAFT_1922485 [Artomyces pyxidatus]
MSEVLLTVKGTYYVRNQAARQSYQRVYNLVHRSSRRKVSKKERKDNYSTKRSEARGDASSYDCYFIHVTRGRDPERTPEMAAREQDLSTLYAELQEALAEEHPEDWLVLFKDRIARDIDEQLLLVQPLLAAAGTHGVDSRARVSQVHGIRRIIGGLRQEVELAEQGVQATAAAAIDKALVWSGRRVNRTKFKKAYGW